MKSHPHVTPGPPISARTLLRCAQYVFLLVGIVALAWYGYIQVGTILFQEYQGWRLDQLQQGKPASATLFAEQWLPIPWKIEVPPKTSASTNRRKGLSPSSAPGANGGLIGRLSIPRLDISAVVMEGTDPHTLRLAVGHLPGTPLPGEPGNVDLAAHRDSFFRGLNKIHRGDMLTVSTVSGTQYSYRVGTMVIASPDNTGILNSSAGPGVNLITCYPFNYVGAAPQRFIVHADQIAASAVPGAQQASSGSFNQPWARQASQIRSADLISPSSTAAQHKSKRPRLETPTRKSQNSLPRNEVHDASTSRENGGPGAEEMQVSETDSIPAARPSTSHANPLRALFRKIFKPRS